MKMAQQVDNTMASGRSADHEVDPVDALRRAARDVGGKQELYRRAARILAAHFDSPFAAVCVESSVGQFQENVQHDASSGQRWEKLCKGLVLDSRYRKLAVAKLFESPTLDSKFTAMAVPISEELEGVVGALVLVAVAESKAVAAGKLAELQALTGLVGMLADRFVAQSSRASSGTAPTVPQSTGAVSAGGHESFQEFAFAITNGLKTKLGCEQVSLGLVEGAAVRIVSISGLDDLYPRSPGVRLIRQAMEECLDAAETICSQQKTTWDAEKTTGHLLHLRWRQQTGDGAVASIPLHVGADCRAVLSLRHRSGATFSESDLAKVQQVVSPLIQGLMLLKKADRGLLRHSLESGANAIQECVAPAGWGRRACLAVLAAGILWALFGTMQFVVSVPCRIVPNQSRLVSAPQDARILAVHVEPGDHVVRGQPLVDFDTRELELERGRLAAEQQIAELELAAALEARQHAPSAKAAARAKMARASLQLIDQKIAKSRLVANASGTIMSGDLKNRVGETVRVGETLLELASDGWMLELHVPQFAASYLSAGQEGRFATTARPDVSHSCQLKRGPVSSSIIDDKHLFAVDCTIADEPSWLRPGMTGVAKIRTGKRPVWWVSVHRIINSVRLYFWQI